MNQLFPTKVISPNGDAKILRKICSMDKADIHSVKQKLDVDWEVFDMRTVHLSIPNGWMLRNATITSRIVQVGLPFLKVVGYLVPFSMPEYLAELKRKQHIFANVNEEWLSYKAISGYQAVQKQLEAANKHKGEIGLDHKYPRVEKAKDFKRRVSGKLQEANQATIKENAFKAYKTLIEENHIAKRFAKKVKGALIANRALNFPEKIRSDQIY